jgi:hypothetical protein
MRIVVQHGKPVDCCPPRRVSRDELIEDGRIQVTPRRRDIGHGVTAWLESRRSKRGEDIIGGVEFRSHNSDGWPFRLQPSLTCIFL